jgi:transposase
MNDLRTAIRLVLSTTLGNREIGRQLAISYNTIRRFRKVIEENNYQLDDLTKLTDTDLYAKFNKVRSHSKQTRMPDFAHIHRELQRKGVTRSLLWLEYKEQDPETAYGLSRFNELYAGWAGKHVLSMRQQYSPGERGWADFSGTKMYWTDTTTGEIHDVEVFVASVSVSGLLFALAVPSQKQEHWIHAHCEWYEFLGGVPQITVPDNLKAAVQKPGRDPILNPAYLEMADHYETIVLPARSRKPKDKATVEGGVLIFLRWAIARLRNRVFHSLSEINVAIVECVEIINNRQMRRYKQSRRERFDQIDKPELHPLQSRYEYGEWIGPMRVPPDYHIAIKGHYYSVPYRLVQQEVYARCTPTTVEFLKEKTRIASHLRSEVVGDKTTDNAHMPEHHRAWAEHTPEHYQQWANSVGPQTSLVIEQLLNAARHPAGALNACSALQKICKKNGKDRFELACGKAIAIHSPTPKSIRSILQNRLEGQVKESEPQWPIPQHVNVRGASYYQNKESTHVE